MKHTEVLIDQSWSPQSDMWKVAEREPLRTGKDMVIDLPGTVLPSLNEGKQKNGITWV